MATGPDGQPGVIVQLIAAKALKHGQGDVRTLNQLMVGILVQVLEAKAKAVKSSHVV